MGCAKSGASRVIGIDINPDKFEVGMYHTIIMIYFDLINKEYFRTLKKSFKVSCFRVVTKRNSLKIYDEPISSTITVNLCEN